MLGLILALLYVAYAVVVGGATANVAVASTLGFLWTWHMVWTCVWGAVIALIFLVGVLAMFAKNGAGVGTLAAFLMAPIMAISVTIHQALFLGAVAIASRAGLGTEHINPTYLVIAGIMYVIAIVSQRGTGAAVSKGVSK